MVHRDLKLENILITAGGDPLNIQVTDFGLAHKKQKGFAEEEERMLDGTCGTLLYMAPEVLENKLAYSDHCDVWSLGVILYELLVCACTCVCVRVSEIQYASVCCVGGWGSCVRMMRASVVQEGMQGIASAVCVIRLCALAPLQGCVATCRSTTPQCLS